MSFGKRPPGTSGPAKTSSTPAGNVPMASPAFIARAVELKLHVELVLRDATLVAEAIRNATGIDGSAYSTFAPDSFPLRIAGLDRHFNFMRDGKMRHAVYAYSRPGGALDRTAQLHLFELATAAKALNAICVDALRDDALAVALQSATVRDNVDRIIVLSGHFAALLENLEASTMARNGGQRLPRLDGMQQRLDEWEARIKDAMLDSQRAESLAPDIGWPVFLYETEADDHEGQLVVNHVYLPKELAGPVMQAMAREQAKARLRRDLIGRALA